MRIEDMRHLRTQGLALCAAAVLASSAQGQVGLESVTFDGQFPEASLFSFFESDFPGFASFFETITGIPKIDSTLGTLVDVQISCAFVYSLQLLRVSAGRLTRGLL